ncbi:MAG TPA: hypothetical protein VHJ54_10150 [Solirubrobacterales bacterium]|jgi:hypothetical protein|nr:hypothetical protein [Solirubrobacterales bacterium]
MRRAAVVGLAALVSLCVVGAADARKQRLKVHTEVSIGGLSYVVPSDTVTLFGEVDAGRPKCERNRRVELFQITEDLFAGSVRSGRGGYWEVSFIGKPIPPGWFEATVTKRKIVKKHKVVRCRADISPPFFGTTFP